MPTEYTRTVDTQDVRRVELPVGVLGYRLSTKTVTVQTGASRLAQLTDSMAMTSTDHCGMRVDAPNRIFDSQLHKPYVRIAAQLPVSCDTDTLSLHRT